MRSNQSSAQLNVSSSATESPYRLLGSFRAWLSKKSLAASNFSDMMLSVEIRTRAKARDYCSVIQFSREVQQ